MNSGHWQLGAYRITGRPTVPEADKQVDGALVRGPLGLHMIQAWDQNETPICAFSLTHIPTGLKVCTIYAQVGRAIAVADEIFNLGDWSGASTAALGEDLHGAVRQYVRLSDFCGHGGDVLRAPRAGESIH